MKRIFILVLSLCVLLCGGCAPKKETITFFSMDTVMELTAFGENAKSGILMAEQEINRLSSIFDRGEGASELFLLNEKGEGKLSEELATILAHALFLSEETDGAFDPTLAAYSDLWGFYGGDYRLPTQEELSSVVSGWEKVTLNDAEISLGGVKLDLGGIAKGYASDRAREVLLEQGITSAILSLGGNVMTIGGKPNGDPWTVAVTDPQNPSGYIGTVKVKDSAVVTSGNYERYFERDGVRYHHILDPKTGCPVENELASVTVITHKGTEADALSTAFYVMGMERTMEYLKEHEGIEVLFITKENQVYLTDGIEFTPTGQTEIHILSK